MSTQPASPRAPVERPTVEYRLNFSHLGIDIQTLQPSNGRDWYTTGFKNLHVALQRDLWRGRAVVLWPYKTTTLTEDGSPSVEDDDFKSYEWEHLFFVNSEGGAEDAVRYEFVVHPRDDGIVPGFDGILTAVIEAARRGAICTLVPHEAEDQVGWEWDVTGKARGAKRPRVMKAKTKTKTKRRT